MQALYKAFERTSALILASENWSKGYGKAPVEHGKLIKATARLERKLLLFFKDQANKSMTFVNWYAYAQALQEVKASRIDAYSVDVIVNNNADNDNDQFISIVYDEVLAGMALGASAGATTYGMPTELSAASTTIQLEARKRVAELVGRRVQDDGTVIENPTLLRDKSGNLIKDKAGNPIPKYSISATTRKRIQEAIHAAIMAGEDVPTAAKRIKKIIKDPKRAALIAQQEMAMAYTDGLRMYGDASGAVGKQWEDNGAIDVCKDNTNAGPLPWHVEYPGGVLHPLQHIGCKCFERIIYQNELTANPDLFNR